MSHAKTYLPVSMFARLLVACALVAIAGACRSPVFVTATASISVNISQPRIDGRAAKGLEAAALGYLDITGSRAIAPGTSRVRLVCSAADIQEPIVASADFISGSDLTLTLENVPVGIERSIAVTAFDAGGAALTEGNAVMTVVAGTNAVALSLRPVNPIVVAAGPTGASGIDVAADRAGFCSIDIPSAGTFKIVLLHDAGPAVLDTELKLYDADGKPLGAAVDTNPSSATYGRVSIDTATTLYAALCAPSAEARRYSLVVDADWTPTLVNGYLPAPLGTAPFVDARGDILIDFPNELPTFGASRSVDSVTIPGTDNTASGKRLAVMYIAGDWPYGTVSDIKLTIDDPIVGGSRDISLPAVNLRKFYWVSPSGTGSTSLRSSPGSLSASVTAANAAPAELEPVFMMQGGAYDTGGMTLSRTMHLFGGWDGASSGAIVVDHRAREAALSSPGPNAALIINGAGNSSYIHGVAIKPASVAVSNAYSLDITSAASPVIWNCAIYSRLNSAASSQTVAIRCLSSTAPIFANTTVNSPALSAYAKAGSTTGYAQTYAIIADGSANPVFLNNVILSGQPNNPAASISWMAYCMYRSPMAGTGVPIAIGNTFVVEDLPTASNKDRSCFRFGYNYGESSIQPHLYNNLFIGNGSMSGGFQSAMYWTGDVSGHTNIRQNAFWGFNASGVDRLYWHNSVSSLLTLSDAYVLDPGASAPGWATAAGSPVLSSGMDPATYDSIVPVSARPFLYLDVTGGLRTAPFAYGAYE